MPREVQFRLWMTARRLLSEAGRVRRVWPVGVHRASTSETAGLNFGLPAPWFVMAQRLVKGGRGPSRLVIKGPSCVGFGGCRTARRSSRALFRDDRRACGGPGRFVTGSSVSIEFRCSLGFRMTVHLRLAILEEAGESGRSGSVAHRVHVSAGFIADPLCGDS